MLYYYYLCFLDFFRFVGKVEDYTEDLTPLYCSDGIGASIISIALVLAIGYVLCFGLHSAAAVAVFGLHVLWLEH
jgi:hypothetical protein